MYFVGWTSRGVSASPPASPSSTTTGRLVHVGGAPGRRQHQGRDRAVRRGRLPGRLRRAAGGRPTRPVSGPSEAALNRDFAQVRGRRAPHQHRQARVRRHAPRAPGWPRRSTSTSIRSSRSPRRAIEVYPHPATVALFRLGRTLKYKAKPGRSVAQLRSELLRLMDLIEGLAQADAAAAGHRPRRTGRELRARGRDGRAQERAAPRRGSGRRRRSAPTSALFATRRPERRHDLRRRRDRRHRHPDAAARPGPRAAGADAGRGPRRHRAATPSGGRRWSARPTATSPLVTTLLDDAGINYLSVTARTKSVASFAAKADRSVDGRRLYTDPLSEITDQIGLRVITFLRDDVTTVANLLGEEMQLLDDRDMGQETAREGRWGYASRHLLVAVEGEQQPASIQVRTVLQHAWAEFEHDIRYKGSIPEEDAPDLDRRFTLAAGLLELADREFSAIRERLRSSPPAQRVRAVRQRPAHRDPGAGDLSGQPLPRRRLVAHRALRLDLRAAAGTRHRLRSTNSTQSSTASTPTRSTTAMGYRYPARRGAPPRRRAAGRVRRAVRRPAGQRASSIALLENRFEQAQQTPASRARESSCSRSVMSASLDPERRLIASVTPNSTMPRITSATASTYCCSGRPDSGVTRYSDVTKPTTGSQVGVLKCAPSACTSLPQHQHRDVDHREHREQQQRRGAAEHRDRLARWRTP